MFIVFEGLDGAGKSTQISLLEEKVHSWGLDPIVLQTPKTREGRDAVAETMRLIFGDQDATPFVVRYPLTESLLRAAISAFHMESRVCSALALGKVVISDRHRDSLYAYQTPKICQHYPQVPEEQILHWLIEVTSFLQIEPDLTIWLDIPEAVAMQRKHERMANNVHDELIFLREVRRLYVELAERYPERIAIVNGELSDEAIAGIVCEAVSQRLVSRGYPIELPEEGGRK